MAFAFHWPPSETAALSFAELGRWHAAAARLTEASRGG